MRALAEADICRFLFFRPLAESAARELPKALTAALIAFNCRSRLAFAFVSFCASFCNAASSFIRTLPAHPTLSSPKRKAEGFFLRLLSAGSVQFSTSSFSFRAAMMRSEEHTSELQSRLHLVCRLLLEKKNTAMRRGSSDGRSVVADDRRRRRGDALVSRRQGDRVLVLCPCRRSSAPLPWKRPRPTT